MSQSRFIEEEYSKKYRKAANNAAINSAITDLVAARDNAKGPDRTKRALCRMDYSSISYCVTKSK
jgi:hypothetical protein